MRTARLRGVLLLMTGLAIVFFPMPARAESATERFFRIQASSFAYTPSQITVNAGDEVTIELVSTDVVHGLYLDEYGLSVVSDPGQTSRLKFVADRPGSFRFRCNVTCGAMHPFMIGRLAVGPNTAFWRAVALALLAATGVLTGPRP
jgi:heme/copper-type cytochrome/quinol oxidase subunit 2